MDDEDALPQHRCRARFPVVEGDEERRGIGPGIGSFVVADVLEALEEDGASLLSVKLHSIAHLPHADPLWVRHEQIESAVGRRQRLSRETWRHDRPHHSRLVVGIGEHRIEIVRNDREGELERRPVLFAAGRPVLEIGRAWLPEPAHRLGEPDADGRGQRRHGRRDRWQAVVDLPPAIHGDEGAGSLGDGRDRQQRVHAEGPGHDRPVGHIQAVIDLRAGGARKDLSALVHRPVRRRLAHHTSAERMHGDEAVVGQLAPHRVLQIRSAERPGRLVEAVADLREDRLVAHAWPLDPRPVLVEHHLTGPRVVRHHQIGLRVADRPGVRPPDEALDLSLALPHKILHTGIGVLANRDAAMAPP